jgi:DNA ligase-associated metallophosphoesterase
MRIEAVEGEMLPECDIALVPGRAAVLPRSATLLIADLHLGKAAAFRTSGLPVPEGSGQRDLARLERLVRRHAIRRVLILGDLFHARSGCTEQVFAEFAETRARLASVEMLLVIGNHDRSVGRLPSGLGLDAMLPLLAEPPFAFVHEPAAPQRGIGQRDLITIGGHLHPTVSLRSPSGDRLTDRAFLADPGVLILPAFGSFTGGRCQPMQPARRFWLARDDGVVEVTPLAAGRP